jgi:dTDP-glucose 4,6-dehydratase
MTVFEYNSHILLTGGTGFFGLSLLRHWNELGVKRPRVSVLSRDPNRFMLQHPDLAPLVEWIEGDVLHVDSLPSNRKFTHVMHAATDSTLGPTLSPMQRYIQIVDGTRNVLELALATGASRFLFTSSGGVYGPQPPEMDKISEHYLGIPDPMNPHNAYSIAKRCAEHLCALFQAQHGLEVVIARCFAFVGQDLPFDAHFAIGNFIRDAMIAPEILVQGDGTPVRSYMDQRDLARWLCTMLRDGHAGEAYNVGSDVPVTIAELAHMVRDVLAPGKRVKIAGSSNPQNFRNRYVPSIDKARTELGLTLSHQLEASIRHSAAQTGHNMAL